MKQKKLYKPSDLTDDKIEDMAHRYAYFEEKYSGTDGAAPAYDNGAPHGTYERAASKALTALSFCRSHGHGCNSVDDAIRIRNKEMANEC